jgi:hypothetical protein
MDPNMGKIRPFVPGHNPDANTRIANPQSRPCTLDWARIEADLKAGKLKAYELCDPEVARKYGG